MKQFIVGQVSTGNLVHKSSIYPKASSVSAADIKTNISNIKDIPENDLSVFEVIDSGIINRIRNKDSYDLVWSKSGITGLDFSPEESKRFIKITTDKQRIVANGSDTATIIIEIWKADLSEIDSKVNADVLMDVRSSFYGQIKQSVKVSSGTATISFSTSIPGTWAFPADPKRYENFRVNNQVTITSFLN